MLFKVAIQNIIAKNLRHKLNKNTITEEDLTPILKEVRTSFLAADVNLRVIKTFLENVKKEVLALGQLSDNQKIDQALFSIIRNQLIEILGKNNNPLKTSGNPLKIMLVGLNGSGKTTTCGKLGQHLKQKHNRKVCFVGLDVYRPAAIEQLRTLSNETQVGFMADLNEMPIKTAQNVLNSSDHKVYDTFLFDTAGRMQNNETLMQELRQLKRVIQPDEILFVVDGMAGQEILSVAQEFHNQLRLTGVIVTKTDADARMGAALSIVSMLQLPIKFLGSGEKVGNLSIFHPERFADRILGMGDLVTLAEKSLEIDQEQKAKKGFMKMLSGQFDLEDLVEQMQQLKKMGSLGSLMQMIPGMNQISESKIEQAELQMRKWEVMLSSMTKKERRNPKLFKKQPNRRLRVIKGSGAKPDEFNKMMKKWEDSKKQIDALAQKIKSKKNPFGGLGF